ncbi:MAG: hypothetical protein AAF394_18870, partial [Planctomycetota bacterium]
YDCVAQTDAEVGAILEALRTDGLLERTAVFGLLQRRYLREVQVRSRSRRQIASDGESLI